MKSEKCSLSKSNKALSRYSLKRRYTPEISVKINLSDVLLQNTLKAFCKDLSFFKRAWPPKIRAEHMDYFLVILVY